MTLDTTTGASLIAEQVSQILVQPLEAASVVLAAGPRIFDSSEPLRIPTLSLDHHPRPSRTRLARDRQDRRVPPRHQVERQHAQTPLAARAWPLDDAGGPGTAVEVDGDAYAAVMTRAEEWQLSEDQSSQHPTAEGLRATAESPAPTAEGPASTFDLGLSLAEQGDQAGAAAALQDAIDSGDIEQAPAAAVNLGVLLAGQGDLAGARVAFQAAIDSGHEQFAPIAELLMGEQCTMGDPPGARWHPDGVPPRSAAPTYS